MIQLISLKCYQIESNLQRIVCTVRDFPSATSRPRQEMMYDIVRLQKKYLLKLVIKNIIN